MAMKLKPFYGTGEAAAYLRTTYPNCAHLSQAALGWHVSVGHLPADLIGNSLIIYREDLDAFAPTLRPRGRPVGWRKSKPA